ncbi:hypothetical protein [Lacticaseibacillus nasuensis]|uniref:hypothetical protein n=1 Tax=Lacticaseibacillus nasuensis TaxID=944671 RepID=UPI001F296758|nr:hypothetical protein [Lacticaseibacillus nasuensis]
MEMLLDYCYTHPQSYTTETERYQNAVALILPDTLILPEPGSLFPPNALDALRLPQELIAKRPDIIAWLARLVNPEEPPVAQQLWLTTSHVLAKRALYIEVAFES